jgi:hypothetical protein
MRLVSLEKWTFAALLALKVEVVLLTAALLVPIQYSRISIGIVVLVVALLMVRLVMLIATLLVI